MINGNKLILFLLFLLIIAIPVSFAGDIDNNVHPANTIRVVDALIRANKRFDMLILPGQRHGFGDMNEYFFWRMADYYSEHLLGKSEKSVDILQLNNDK